MITFGLSEFTINRLKDILQDKHCINCKEPAQRIKICNEKKIIRDTYYCHACYPKSIIDDKDIRKFQSIPVKHLNETKEFNKFIQKSYPFNDLKQNEFVAEKFSLLNRKLNFKNILVIKKLNNEIHNVSIEKFNILYSKSKQRYYSKQGSMIYEILKSGDLYYSIYHIK